MPITTPQQLFLHELGDMYDAEQRIEQMLPTIIHECADKDMAMALKEHLQETRHQVENIERCFSILGAQPYQPTCAIVVGMQQEHDAFVREQPSGPLLMLFDVGGVAKTEQYEITAYHTLIAQCKLMGQSECVTLLQENLRQEETMAQKVEQFSRQLGSQVIGQWDQSDLSHNQFMPNM
jgi:ferritin-like metal-binding protein YciE